MTRHSSIMGSSSSESWGFKRRKVLDADIDVTPMVDCVFLLLSFFMVTSPMHGNPDRNIPAAENGVGINPLGVVNLRISGTKDAPHILIDRREASLSDVRAYVAEQAKLGRKLVVIKADGMIPVALVQSVAREATSVEGVKFSIGVRSSRQHR